MKSFKRPFCIFDNKQTLSKMPNVVKGVFENGQITLTEKPPVEKKTTVLVTFVSEPMIKGRKMREAGVLSGKIKMSEDFDDPLEDFAGFYK
jgi:hypothetical protein